MDQQITILNQDILDTRGPDRNNKMDVIVSNPPYKKKDSGRLNPNSQKAIARHELYLSIDLLCKISNTFLKPGGKLHLIFPAERSAELITVMNQHYLTPESICFVHTKKNEPAKRILVTGIKNGRQNCTILAPIFLGENKKTIT